MSEGTETRGYSPLPHLPLFAVWKLPSPLVRKSDPGVVMRAEDMQEFLAGKTCWNFRPYGGALSVAAYESPLKRKPPPRDDFQGELWGYWS